MFLKMTLCSHPNADHFVVKRHNLMDNHAGGIKSSIKSGPTAGISAFVQGVHVTRRTCLHMWRLTVNCCRLTANHRRLLPNWRFIVRLVNRCGFTGLSRL